MPICEEFRAIAIHLAMTAISVVTMDVGDRYNDEE
jgi:hypothetical protein